MIQRKSSHGEGGEGSAPDVSEERVATEVLRLGILRLKKKKRQSMGKGERQSNVNGSSLSCSTRSRREKDTF